MGLVKNASITTGTQIVGIVLSLAASIVLARGLGPLGLGQYVIIIFIVGLSSNLLSLGIENANVYFRGKKTYSVSQLFGNSLLWTAGLSLIFFVLAALVMRWQVALDFFALKAINLQLIWLAVAAMPLLLLLRYNTNILLGEEKIWQYNWVTLAQTIAQMVILVIFWVVSGLSLTAAIWSYVLSMLVPVILGIIFLNQTEKLRPTVSREIFKNSWRYGIVAHIASISQFLNYRLDTFILAIFSSPVAVGFYNIAVGMAERLWIVSSAPTTLMFPKAAAGVEAETVNLTARLGRQVIILSVIGGLVMAALAYPVIVIFYGREFLPALGPLVVLLPGIVLLGFGRVVGAHLFGSGKPHYGAKISLIALALTVILDLALIPWIGIMGAAIASTIAYGVHGLLMTRAFVKEHPEVGFGDLLLPRKADFMIYGMYWRRYILKRADK